MPFFYVNKRDLTKEDLGDFKLNDWEETAGYFKKDFVNIEDAVEEAAAIAAKTITVWRDEPQEPTFNQDFLYYKTVPVSWSWADGPTFSFRTPSQPTYFTNNTFYDGEQQ